MKQPKAGCKEREPGNLTPGPVWGDNRSQVRIRGWKSGLAEHPGRERTQEARAGNSFRVKTNATQCPPAGPGANSPRGPSRGLRARRRESGGTRGREPESEPQHNFNAWHRERDPTAFKPIRVRRKAEAEWAGGGVHKGTG